MRGLNNDSAVGRGLRTVIQVAIAVIVAVVKVPGVPEAVYNVIHQYSGVSVAVIAGVVSVVWNILRKDVDNV